MPDDLVTNLRLAARPTKPEQINQMRESGQGPVLSRTAKTLLPLDGSRDMEGHLRLPFGDPTDPLHAAKWEHITSLRDGTALQDGALATRTYADASVTPSKLDRGYLQSTGGFVTGYTEVQHGFGANVFWYNRGFNVWSRFNRDSEGYLWT